jgi:hypothetical protein
MEVNVERYAPAALPHERDSVSILQESGSAPEPVRTDAENLDSYRDSIPGPSSP